MKAANRIGANKVSRLVQMLKQGKIRARLKSLRIGSAPAVVEQVRKAPGVEI